MPQWDGKRDDPLADGDVRDDLFNQMGGRFRHTAGATSGAKSSAFTGECQQFFMGAVPTPYTQKSMGQDSAFQKCVELVFDTN